MERFEVYESKLAVGIVLMKISKKKSLRSFFDL